MNKTIKTKISWSVENVGILARVKAKMGKRDADALEELDQIAFDTQFMKCGCGQRPIDYMEQTGHFIHPPSGNQG